MIPAHVCYAERVSRRNASALVALDSIALMKSQLFIKDAKL